MACASINLNLFPKLVPQDGIEPPHSPYKSEPLPLRIQGLINTYMITSDEAVQVLLDVCKGKYQHGASYSEVKHFTPSFPKKPAREFIPDKSLKRIGTGTRTRT